MFLVLSYGYCRMILTCCRDSHLQMMIRVRVKQEMSRKSINLGCKHEMFCLLYSVILNFNTMLQSTSSCVSEKQMLNFKNEMYR